VKTKSGDGAQANDRPAAVDSASLKIAEETLLKAGALQSAIFNSANFSSIATDARGVIQIFNVGAERMLGYTAAEVVNKITPADISDPSGADRPRQGAQRRTGHPDHAGLRGAGVQGLARDRGHL
jgi:PAS domain-containing protein